MLTKAEKRAAKRATLTDTRARFRWAVKEGRRILL